MHISDEQKGRYASMTV